MALNRKIAYVNLRNERVEILPVADELAGRFLGGQGVGSYLLYTHTAPGKKPLSPRSVVIISAGLLVCTPGFPSVSSCLSMKSPESGTFASIPISGPFASELRWAGFDHLVITGRSETPVYLFIKNGSVTVKSADSLLETDTHEIHTRIRKELKNEEIRIIASDHKDFGTLFKSKNLTAVACKGNMDIEIKNPNDAITLGRKSIARVKADKENQGPDKKTVQVRPVKHSESQLYLQRAAGCLGIDPAINPITASNGSFNKDITQLIQCNTGKNISQRKLKEIGKRCFVVERLFNLREKVSMQRELDNAQPDDIVSLKKIFYQSGEWEKDGTPARQLLERLKISDLWPD